VNNGARVSRQDAAEVWQDVLSRAFQVFSYYHWYWLEIENPNLKTDNHSITVKNAALESSLMSIRDLDDFFGSSGKQKDDVIAADFGYSSSGRFLSMDEREGINKKLAHLTYRGVHERRKDGAQPNPRTWNFAELAARAMTRFTTFLGLLEINFFVGDAAQQGLVQSARRTIDLTLANIKALAKHELEFNA
jgi:hypothetical protein